MLIGLLVLAVVIVLGLALWAWSLQGKVHVKEAQEAVALAQLQADAEAQRQRVNKSVQVIAMSVLNGNEISLTEASMRLSVLLESLGVEDSAREELAPIFKLADATAHIPILAEWKKLPRNQKLAFDQQRLQLEKDYADFVKQCCRNLRGRDF